MNVSAVPILIILCFQLMSLERHRFHNQSIARRVVMKFFVLPLILRKLQKIKVLYAKLVTTSDTLV